MSFSIGREGLIPGQWIVFGHEKKSISEELRGPFKVTNRDDPLFDECRSILMNLGGELVDYCPRLCMLGLKTLPWGYNVKVLSDEKITKTFDRKLEERNGS